MLAICRQWPSATGCYIGFKQLPLDNYGELAMTLDASCEFLFDDGSDEDLD